MPFKRHSVNVMLKSSNNDRCTPDNLLVLVREVFNGPIDLDPCDKVLAPRHGFNSERSQRAENGGRP